LHAALDEDAGNALPAEVAQYPGERVLFVNQRPVTVLVGKKMRFRRQMPRPRKDHAPRLASATDASNAEAWVIRSQRACADEDGIDLRA